MPLTGKGEKILKNMQKEYGTDKGKSVFYASKNKGTIQGVEAREALRRFQENLVRRQGKRKRG